MINENAGVRFAALSRLVSTIQIFTWSISPDATADGGADVTISDFRHIFLCGMFPQFWQCTLFESNTRFMSP
jgi:hypothetical protein